MSYNSALLILHPSTPNLIIQTLFVCCSSYFYPGFKLLFPSYRKLLSLMFSFCWTQSSTLWAWVCMQLLYHLVQCIKIPIELWIHYYWNWENQLKKFLLTAQTITLASLTSAQSQIFSLCCWSNAHVKLSLVCLQTFKTNLWPVIEDSGIIHRSVKNYAEYNGTGVRERNACPFSYFLVNMIRLKSPCQPSRHT